MDTDTTTFTPADFARAVLAHANDTTVNPVADGMCLYIGENDRHCLIGQTLVDLGVDIWSVDEIEQNLPASDLPWSAWMPEADGIAVEDVESIAAILQGFADGRPDPKGGRHLAPWTDAIVKARTELDDLLERSER